MLTNFLFSAIISLRIFKKVGEKMINVLKIKGRMKEKNLTQEALAEKMELNPSTLNYKINSENGEYLSISEVEKLIDILEIPKSELSFYFFCWLTWGNSKNLRRWVLQTSKKNAGWNEKKERKWLNEA